MCPLMISAHYCGVCSVLLKVFSTLEDDVEYTVWVYHQYIAGCSVPWGVSSVQWRDSIQYCWMDSISIVGDAMNHYCEVIP